MKKLTMIVLAVMCANSAFADVGDLSVAISRVRVACSGISDSMSGLKTRAGINTALTGVGTAAGGVALGTGLVKASTDGAILNWKNNFNKEYAFGATKQITQQQIDAAFNKYMQDLNTGKDLRDTSKTFGNIRTGTMAGAAVTDTIGTVLAAKNQVDDDLDNRIQRCKSAVGGLSGERLRARAENTATVEELERANNIVNACSEWENVDLSKIDKRAKGAAISSGTGALLALAGTITSAEANKQSALDKDYNKGLDTTSNVLAGGTTAASLTATIFNATQISAIKKAVNAADKCEEALK